MPDHRSKIYRIGKLKTALATTCLLLIVSKRSLAEDNVSAKWQDYSEDDGRIHVISKYIGVEKQVTESVRLNVHAVNDAITGATPTGSPDEDGTVPLSYMEEERNSVVTDVVWEHGTNSESFEYSRSKESDFLSIGYAYTHTSEFNKRNTRLSLGVSYTDDEIFAGFMPETETKDSTDFFVGISQVLDPNTIVTANLSYGKSSGYLNDPYKIIRQDTELLPGLFLPLTFPENRPNEKNKKILFLNTKHHFTKVNGTADISYRYFKDSWDLDSHTLSLEWYQKIGEKLILIPKLRLYRQSAASIYQTDLNEADFAASDTPDGSGPNYSADYRLAELESTGYGIKLVYKTTERLSLDIDLERYEMSGRDSITPASAFPDADVLTLGLTFKF